MRADEARSARDENFQLCLSRSRPWSAAARPRYSRIISATSRSLEWAFRTYALPRSVMTLRGKAYVRKAQDRKSTRLNSSHANISYAVFCLKKKKKKQRQSSPTDTRGV